MALLIAFRNEQGHTLARVSYSYITLFDVFDTRQQMNTRKEMARINRFYHVIIGARVKSSNFVLQRRLRGQQHDGQMAQRGLMADKAT